MKRTLIISAILSLLLTGCSVGNVTVSKRENPTEPKLLKPITADDATSSDSDSSSNENEQSDNVCPDVPETAKLGERFCIVVPASSGHLYLTLNKCEVYDNLNDAGVEYDELEHNILIEGINYDPQTTALLDEMKIIMLHMTVENIDAISVYNETMPDHFGKYDFSMRSFGYIPGASFEYLNSRVEDAFFYDIIHIEPNETKNFIVGFVLPTKYEPLENAVFTNGDEHSLTLYTVVNLELGE